MSFHCEEFSEPIKIISELKVPDALFIEKSRAAFTDIFQEKDNRFVIILGPCSIDHPESALKYAKRVAALQKEVAEQFLLIMRVYLEKPRTGVGWTGYLTEPNLSFNPVEGIKKGRELLCAINELHVPVATEFVSPFTAPYISDLITWGCIGARTTYSILHRQMAATLPMPIGFKNSLEGCFFAPIHGIKIAQNTKQFLGMNPEGKISIIHTGGNQYCHMVLRGGSFTGPNYDIPTIKSALQALEEANLPAKILVDCSHHNSGKKHEKQIEVFQKLLEYRERGLTQIFGAMIESYLISGKQKEPIQLGQSITDPCLGWEETQKLILDAAPCFC